MSTVIKCEPEVMEAGAAERSQASHNWRQDVALRVAAHRNRTAKSDELPVSELPAAMPETEERRRASRIAAAVAARYAAAPTYRQMMESAENTTVMTREPERTEFVSAAEESRAQLAEEVPAAAAIAVAEVPPAPEPVMVAAPEIPIVTYMAPAPSPVYFESIDAVKKPSASVSVDEVLLAEMPEVAAAPKAPKTMRIQMLPEPPESLAPELLPVRVIDSPREIIAVRRMRPRLAEGVSLPEKNTQLRIFEVEADQISTQPEPPPPMPTVFGAAEEPEYFFEPEVMSEQEEERIGHIPIVYPSPVAPSVAPVPQQVAREVIAWDRSAPAHQEDAYIPARASFAPETYVEKHVEAYAETHTPAFRQTHNDEFVEDYLEDDPYVTVPMPGRVAEPAPAVKASTGAVMSRTKEPGMRECDRAATLVIQTAPIELRLMAMLVDTCGVVALALAGFAVRLIYSTHPAAVMASLRSLSKVGVAEMVVGFVALWLMYQMFWFAVAGSTPGMRYARIGLCTFEDENPSRLAMCGRALAQMLSLCPLGLGYLWALMDMDGLGWHDRVTHIYQRGY